LIGIAIVYKRWHTNQQFINQTNNQQNLIKDSEKQINDLTQTHKNYTNPPNISLRLYKMYLDYQKNGIEKIEPSLDFNNLECWLTTNKELTKSEITQLNNLGVNVKEYHKFKDHFYYVEISITAIPDIAKLDFVIDLEGAWDVGMPENE